MGGLSLYAGGWGAKSLILLTKGVGCFWGEVSFVRVIMYTRVRIALTQTGCRGRGWGEAGEGCAVLW